jgi:sortase A
VTANDRHAIPPFPPSHATVPSPDKLSQHTFQFVDAQRLFRDQFVALVDDELRLGELRKRILRFRCRRLRIIAHKIMMPNDAQVVAVQDYNKRLAESGQPILGEAKDPFADVRGGSRASVSDSGESDNEAGESGPQLSDSGESDNQSGAGTGADAGSASASSADAEYRSLLDSGGGVMGTIRIPKISVRLPIYHGTSESALASGAGHLYGSSLPVGGKSTHAVLTGHRGLVEAAMFTRLDEMRVGDYFYIEVMGRTLGYQVDRITVIEPNDTSQLKIVPGEDRVTLMTCTPYGVNTHRLLVSATHSAIPDEIPAENDAVKDARAIGAITGIATLVVGVLLVWLRRKPWHIRRHAAWWPKRG